MDNSSANNESVGDVQNWNQWCLESLDWRIKKVEEGNAALKNERDSLLAEGANARTKLNKLRDLWAELTEKRDNLKMEKKKYRLEKHNLQTDVDHFKKDGENNRKKLRQLDLILDDVE